ncbi:sulfite exporter TauE/SafE family protein [Roseibium sediminis]|uniref:sulfite exporter TauE/SafE family protein n=1 Tax=Roseibium sediminis TaxID=1775174 RepID=UPI00123DEC3C|nr:sulfite exporter TauE/SafE family protein [Roseibium sediminis]
MLTSIAAFAELPVFDLVLCMAAVFVAGLVRGFAGFGLSAILMASIVLILPPIQLIPICYVLESAASLAMFRGGIRDADMRIVWLLVVGSAIGVPLGLWATTTVPVDVSRKVALVLILVLTILQFFKIAPKNLGRTSGPAVTGVVAGIATGLASVGGMVVALYVLASDVPARVMRASLVMYLFTGMFTSAIFLYLYDVMTMEALKRGAVLAPAVLAGVFLGSFLFRPSLAPYYKAVCLALLGTLSLSGLARLAF